MIVLARSRTAGCIGAVTFALARCGGSQSPSARSVLPQALSAAGSTVSLGRFIYATASGIDSKTRSSLLARLQRLSDANNREPASDEP
jgi:hypothetical protein